ncbi:MAG: glycosyltransferase family 4 protein [bacterium]
MLRPKKQTPKNLNILIVDEWFLSFPYFWGGGQVQTWEIARIHAKNGHSVHVLCSALPGKPASQNEEGVFIHRFWTLRRIPKLAKISSWVNLPFFLLIGLVRGLIICRKYRIDLLDGNMFSGSLLAWLLAKLTGKKCINRVHDLMLKETWKKIGFFRAFYQWVLIHLPFTLYVTVSQAMKEKLHKDWSIPLSKIDVIYNGVDLNFIDSIPPGEKQNQITFIGRLVEHKHPDLLIPAFKKYIEPKYPDFKILIIGSGPLEEDLKKMAEGNSKITIITNADDKEKIKHLKSSSFLVLPSEIEGFGIVLVEAYACGKPVIAGNIPPSFEIVKEGVSGFICDFSVESIGETMIKMLNSDLEKMGKEGRRIVEEKFTWEKSAQLLLESYYKSVNE